MKEYGVAESWTKVVTIDGQEGPGQLQRALNFRRNGDILIETRGRELVSYGQTFLENQEFEFPFSPQFNLEYYRSLFSLQIDMDNLVLWVHVMGYYVCETIIFVTTCV